MLLYLILEFIPATSPVAFTIWTCTCVLSGMAIGAVISAPELSDDHPFVIGGGR